MTVSASYNAVPFMLMVAPRGSTNWHTSLDTPKRLQQRIVTGSVAAEESVPNAVISGVKLHGEHAPGTPLVKMFDNEGY